MACLKTIGAWLPVGALLLLSQVLAIEGLREIALICLLAAIISQFWRYDFPCVPLLCVLLGWNSSSVITNRALILPASARVIIIISCWSMAFALTLLAREQIFIALGLVVVATATLLLRLRAVLGNALSLEQDF